MNETPFDKFLEVLKSCDVAEKAILEQYLGDEVKQYKVKPIRYSVEKHNYGVSVTIGGDISFRFDSHGNLIEVFNYRFS